MVEIYIILSLVIGIAIGFFLANQKNKGNDEELEGIKEEMEKAFKSVAFDVNKSNTEEFLKIADDKFQSISKQADKELENKKKLIDGNLETMSKKLQSIEEHSIQLNQSLENTNTQTKDLKETTAKLREILSSSQKRGQWGERIVEDILNVIG